MTKSDRATEIGDRARSVFGYAVREFRSREMSSQAILIENKSRKSSRSVGETRQAENASRTLPGERENFDCAIPESALGLQHGQFAGQMLNACAAARILEQNPVWGRRDKFGKIAVEGLGFDRSDLDVNLWDAPNPRSKQLLRSGARMASFALLARVSKSQEQRARIAYERGGEFFAIIGADDQTSP